MLGSPKRKTKRLKLDLFFFVFNVTTMEVYLGLALLVVVVIVAYIKFVKPAKDAERKVSATAQNEKIRRTLSEIRRRNSLTNGKASPSTAKKVHNAFLTNWPN